MKKITAIFLVIAACSAPLLAKDSKIDAADVVGGNAKKSFVGWVDSSSKDIDAKEGIIKFKVKPNLGTFNISVVNEKEKSIPVISSAEEFTTSSLFLKTSKKTVKLLADANTKVTVNKKNDGITITYAITNLAEVAVNFDCIQSSIDADDDIVKVTIKITNKSNKRDDFAIKQIIDTVLGETGAYHFYTSDNMPVKNEVLYRNLKNQKWFMSKNNSAAAQFIFTGGDTTTPEILALANYSTLDKKSWEPDMLNFRTFDTVLSYNNSAIGVIWPSVKIAPKESSEIVYYIALAADGDEPAGEQYVYGVKAPEKESSKKEVRIVDEPEVELKEDSSDEKTTKEVPNVDFTVNGIPKDHFTQEYIQQLLDRITELESDGSNVNRQELLDLNAELDAILSVLR